jgi:hypothetical protein
MDEQIGEPLRVVTSLSRPGRLRTAVALASTSVKRSSSRCHTGFQYSPVDSSTACVQPAATRHPSNTRSPAAVVANVRTFVLRRSRRRHPHTSHHGLLVHVAHRAWMMSIVAPPVPPA